MSKRLSALPAEFSTLVQILRWRALHQPDRWAYTFLVDGGRKEINLAYKELDRQARVIGALLQSLEATGERALLLYPPGLGYIAAFFGCLYAGVIAVPTYPSRLNRPDPRLQAVVTDAQATLALTNAHVLSNLERRLTHTPTLEALHWLATDDLDSGLAAEWRDLVVKGDTLALLQYTSGSTTTPKGVMVSHDNILYNERMIQQAFGQSEQSVIVGWLPIYHDMGLIGNVLQPLYVGARCVLMSPLDFLQNPFRWLQAISHYKAHTSGGPNFGYDLCVRKVAPEQRAMLDLSSWEVAFNGAEPVRHQTLERFAAAFESCGFRREAFYPCYGLAEATLFVSGGIKSAPPVFYTVQGAALEQDRVVTALAEDEDARVLVGCGRTWADQKIVIADPASLTPCPNDQVGEIWVAGPNVAWGYWGETEETERAFRAHLMDTGEGPFLRTGDLGFLKDGELFVTGRIKDLIIIRGRNHYPQDIELTVEQCHVALRLGCGAAFSMDVDDEERLVVVQELKRTHRKVDVEEVARAIRQAVAEDHELQVYAIVLVSPMSIPKTSSGKIRRYVCRAMFLEGKLKVIGSSILDTPTADALADQLGENFFRNALVFEDDPTARLSLLTLYLQRQVARVLRSVPSQVDTHRPLNTFGLDSLMAVELRYKIETSLGMDLPVAGFLQGESIAHLASDILAQLTEPVSASEATLAPASEPQSEYPLSYGQQALWFLHQLAPESAAYNVPIAVRIRSELDVAALRRAFHKLAGCHVSLRTTFAVSHASGEPVQRIHEQVALDFEAIDASAWSERGMCECLGGEVRRPFNLERDPLLRIRVFKRSSQEYILLLMMHHIITDFWSLAVLVRQLSVVYSAECVGDPVALPLPELQYTDYVRWQAEMLARPRGKELQAYWQNYLSGELPVLDLPTDHPRPPTQTYNGSVHTIRLSTELTEQLKVLGQAQGATLNMALLAAFQVLLYRYTGQEDFLVGSLSAGRSRSELAELVGYFVNPLVLRARPSPTQTFTAFLGQTRQALLASLAHQDYPFDLLVSQLRPIRDNSRSPLFQIMFIFQKAYRFDDQRLTSFALDIKGAQMELAGLQLESMALEHRTAQFDLTLRMGETDGGLVASFEYNTDLFEAITIARMAAHFQTVLQGIVADPEQCISELPLLTEAERRRMLVVWNDTEAEYPRDCCVHELFEAQVEQTPDAVALVFNDQHLTYRELNGRSNQLACYLQGLEVGPEVLVGVCMERSLEMVVGLLGALKAGAAYVPLDPVYPEDRLAFMLDDARLPVLLTQSQLVKKLPRCQVRIICLDADWETVARMHRTAPPCLATTGSLAYAIYTSGSTGKPKGVQIPQSAVVNFLNAMRRQPGLMQQDILLSVTTISFDIAVLELLLPLYVGARVELVSRATLADGVQLMEKLASSCATIMQATPAIWRLLMLAGWKVQRGLRIFCGGEALPRTLANQLLEGGAILWNLYGPTETTVWSTACEVEWGEDPVFIGHPIDNTQVYLLDPYLQPVPVGVPAELYIGGVGLSRGYLGQPQLTSGRFIPNPFGTEPGSRLYRTGDRVCYLPDGNIEFLNRLDHQVKVRGFRIELGEIETVLSQHPGVRETVVLAREDEPGDLSSSLGAGKRLVAYVVPKEEQEFTMRELRRFLAGKLPQYMVPSAFVILDTLPLLPNGKVARKMLPAPEWGRPEFAQDFVAGRTLEEEMLAGIWAQVLGVEQVGVHDNFFELGGHSLLATQVISRIRQTFQVELPVRALFELPTIASLARRLEMARRTEQRSSTPPMQPVAQDGEFPVSFAQQRMWFLDQLAPGNPFYNMPAVVRLTGQLDTIALAQALDEISRRHETLRTTFRVVDGRVVQVVASSQSIPLPVVDLQALPIARREAESQRWVIEEARSPFDLMQGPLVRATLLRISKEEHILLLITHHIVSDGWSVGIFIRELGALYQAFTHGESSPLSDLPIQYADFAVWQRQWLQSEFLEDQLVYWKQQLDSAPTVLKLATDRPRPAVQSFRGARQSLALPSSLTKALKVLSQKEGGTLFMTLLAAFKVLLYRYAGQEDILIGSPIANRNQVEIEGLIGFFANMMVLRTDLSGNPTFRELLRRVHEVTLEAYVHQDLPFEMLVEELQPERGRNQTPLVQVVFVLQNALMEALELPGLVLRLSEVDTGTAKFDLTLSMEDTGSALEGWLEYNTDLFDAATIARMAGHFQTLLEGVVTDPDQRLSDLPLLTEAESRQLLVDWNPR